jgi:hypothetical protein
LPRAWTAGGAGANIIGWQQSNGLERAMRQLILPCAAVFVLAGCERSPEPAATEPAAEASPAKASVDDRAQASGELQWARAALARNPNLEVIAVDSQAQVFTVRDRASGDVQAVNVADLAAVPVASLPTEPAAAIAADGGVPGDGGSPDTPVSSGELDYKVERSGDQVTVSGPGVSIVSAGSAAAAATSRDAGRSTVDPIICDGPRVLQLNDRRIFVDGDAITARGGCELHITNSRISASGRGVVIRDAVVHITNSEIEGAAGSFDAAAGARVILQGATLKGAMRREEGANIQELGGNQWN